MENRRSPSDMACAVASAAIACAMALPACRQVVGVSDRSVGSSDPNLAICQGAPLPPAPCDACSVASCCEDVVACQTDSECAGVHACIAECSLADRDCRAACMSAARDFGIATPLSSCQAATCAAACSMTCGGWLFREKACESCVQSQCCALAEDCSADPMCRAVEACVQRCPAGDWGCYLDCNASSVEGATKDGLLYQCVSTKCPGECGTGRLWTCVGKTRAARTSQTSIEYYLRATDLMVKPVQGAAVRACWGLFGACEIEAASGVTDDQGAAELTIEIGVQGAFRGWFEVSAPGRMPALVRHVPDLTGMAPVYPVYLPTDAEVQLLANAVDTTPQDNLGHAVLRLLDCGSAQAVGVVVTPPSGGAIVRYADVSDPLAPGKPSTDASGLAAVFNVEPGFVGFEVKDGATGAVLITATLEIRPKTLTVATLAPH